MEIELLIYPLTVIKYPFKCSTVEPIKLYHALSMYMYLAHQHNNYICIICHPYPYSHRGWVCCDCHCLLGGPSSDCWGALCLDVTPHIYMIITTVDH